jgi:hypothetical protein
VLEREVAEQRALQRLHLVDLRLHERARLAEGGADDVRHAAGLAHGVLEQLAALDGLGVVGAQLLAIDVVAPGCDGRPRWSARTP